jgi:putative ABC transport system permease protein
MQAWMKKFAYRAPVSVWLFVLAAVLAIVVALLTVSLQTLKAARSNPVDSLKYE